jgi:multidrug resistance efflux pump
MSKKTNATMTASSGSPVQQKISSTKISPVSADAHARSKALEAMLGVDDRIRKSTTETELQHLIVNETRKLTGARQIFLARKTARHGFRVAAVSSLALVERDTPFVRWIESIIRKLCQERGETQPVDFSLPAFTSPEQSETETYPFRHLHWQPLTLSSRHSFAGMLLARERPWSEHEKKLIERQAGVYTSAWKAIHGHKSLRKTQPLRHWIPLTALLLFLVGAFIPVPMTALSPMEIVERNAGLVTAPLDGVVSDIAVKPNTLVKKGQVILSFEDTTLRNRLEVAQRDMLVAEAKYDRAQRAAFSDPASRHELEIAKTEFNLKKAERDYAADALARTKIVASTDGILIYSDPNKLLGRPVKTGERLMKIGNPADVEVRIDLPVADAIVLEKGAEARLFLDSDPLNPVSAKIVSEAYHAEPNSTQQLVYKLRAKLAPGVAPPRIGSRGTAQIYGQQVPFFFYLLHKPISAARQYLGL